MEKEFNQKEQETKTNQPLFEILTSLDRVLKQKGDSPLVFDNGCVTLVNGKTELLRITDKQILAGGRNYATELATPKGFPKNISQTFEGFINEIADHVVRLNVLGVGYECETRDQEVDNILNYATVNEIPVWQEQAAEDNEEWFYLGENKDWKQPFFRVVLGDETLDPWLPNLALDLDTDLPYEKVKGVLEKWFGEGVIGWQLDIPNYGTVVAIGKIGGENETKLAIGLGTNLRNTRGHRESFLRCRIKEMPDGLESNSPHLLLFL